MSIEIYERLKKIMNKKEHLVLDQKRSSRLVINMGNKKYVDGFRIPTDDDLSNKKENRLVINIDGKHDNGFRIPTEEDLSDKKENRLKVSIDNKDGTLELIKQYVKENTSGIRYYYDNQEEGKMIITFSEFVKMIEDGYNIIKAEVFNERMISVEYQKEMSYR